MLDFFTIFSKGGILMWCFKEAGLQQKEWDAFTPAVNAFIKAVLLQDKSGNSSVAFESGSLALKYRLDNEFELVLVAAYQKVLPLLYLDRLLDEVHKRFRDRFMWELRERKYHALATFKLFSDEFAKTLVQVEASSKARELQKKSEMRSFVESAKSQKTIASMMIENSSNGSNNNLNSGVVKASKKKCGQSKKTVEIMEDGGDDGDEDGEVVAPRAGDVDEETRLANINKMAMRAAAASKKGPKGKSPKAEKQPKKGKEKTVWDPFVFGGRGATGEEARMLDRSNQHQQGNGNEEQAVTDVHLAQFLPDSSVVGRSANLGDIDLEESDEEQLEMEANANGGQKVSGGGIWASLASLVGSKKLTREDIEPGIAKMKDHLIAKNVASDVAANLCESLALKLEGRVCGTFSTIHRTVKDTLTEALMQLLTPRRRVDIIRDVYEAKRGSRPYVITFCGVNGVGKSTNLAKICFWLVENKFRVLIAACDTFRAGAVEQLRTHSKRLNSLYPASNQPGGKPVVELYEKGYGKDAAGIAMEAINYARQAKIDVVLVDTAGRMQDNEPLMRSLTKLISVNDPDLVLFVGEALVGNEAVDQLVKFNKALADHSQSHVNPHLIDGIVLTKFDTIDDKVGSAISMTYITGQPIVFVGTGQTYTDLKSLNARAVVQSLMK